MRFDEETFFNAFTRKLLGMTKYFLQNFPEKEVQALAKKVRLALSVNNEEVIGWTDGVLIHGETSVKFLPGLVFHEVGHLLYTWFPGARLLADSLRKGEFPKKLVLPEDEEKIRKIEEELKVSKGLRGSILQNILLFSNIVEDSFLERTLLAGYRVMMAHSLLLLRDHLWNVDIEGLSKLQEGIDSGKITEMKALTCLFLSYGKYGKVKRKEDAELSLPIAKTFRTFSSSYLEVVKEKSKKLRFQKMLSFYCNNLYDFAKKEYEEVTESMKNGQSSPEPSTKNPGNGLETGSDEPGDNSSPLENVDISAPGGESSPENAFSDESLTGEETEEEGEGSKEGDAQTKAGQNVGGDGTSHADDIPAAEKDMDDFLKRVEEIAQNEEINAGKEENAKEVSAKAVDEKCAKSVLKADFHKDVSFQIYDMNEKNTDKEVYEKVYRTVSRYVEPAAKKLKKLFESLKRNYPKRGLWYSGRMDVRTASNPNVGIFRQNIFSEPKADLAVFLLIDESGSMWSSERYVYAARAAIMIEAMCRMLHIPLAVYGHSCSSSVDLFRYRDFDSPEEAKYSLPKISARENNRDGFAIRFGLEKLMQRKEERRLFIILSDGRPSSFGYSGKYAEDDIRDAVSKAKGCEIIAAAIGDDKELISNIYGEKHFLDCTNLAQLGENLIPLIKKRAFH